MKVNLKNYNKIFIVFLVIMLVFFPSLLVKESLSYTKLICVSVGIDAEDDGYEVSCQVVVPKQNNAFNESLKVISGKGYTIKDAIDKINLYTGKDVGISHCGYIVYNQKALEKNVMKTIDYFTREHNIDYNCVLFSTNNSAKEILELNGTLQQSYSFDLKKILQYDEVEVFGQNLSIEEAYRANARLDGTFFMPLISTIDDDSKGLKRESSSGDSQSSGGGQSQAGSGEGDSGQGSKVILNDGKVVILKNGVKVDESDKDTLKAISYLSNSNNFNIQIRDFTDGNIENATINLEIKNKKVFTKSYIKDNRPIIEYNFYIDTRVVDVSQENFKNEIKSAMASFDLVRLKSDIIRQETNAIQNTINYLKSINADAIGAYKRLNKYNYHKFNDYLNNLDDKDKYFQNTKFIINYHINTIAR